MLIEFKVENFLSYNEMTSFSMVAGKERISTETLASVKKFRLKLCQSRYLRCQRFRKKQLDKGTGISSALGYDSQIERQDSPPLFLFH